MLNKQMINAVSQATALTDSIILKYPQTVATTQTQDVMMAIDVSKFDPDKFDDIPLNMNFRRFLNILKLFDDYNITINENIITIKDGNGKMTSDFVMSAVELMDAYNKDYTQFERTKECNSVGVFELTTNDIKKLRGAGGTFEQIEEVIFEAQSDGVKVSLSEGNRFNKHADSFTLIKESCDGECKKNFSVKIPFENFNLLPLADYIVHIKYNSVRDKYRLYLENKNAPEIKLILSVKI